MLDDLEAQTTVYVYELNIMLAITRKYTGLWLCLCMGALFVSMSKDVCIF